MKRASPPGRTRIAPSTPFLAAIAVFADRLVVSTRTAFVPFPVATGRTKLGTISIATRSKATPVVSCTSQRKNDEGVTRLLSRHPTPCPSRTVVRRNATWASRTLRCTPSTGRSVQAATMPGR